MKCLGFLLTLILSSQVFAAKFTAAQNINSGPAQKLADVVNWINQQQPDWDAGNVLALNFTRSASEKNATTKKQLSYAKGGATVDDTQKYFQGQDVATIVDYALFAVENGELEEEVASYRQALTAALNDVKADSTLEVYGSGHADEDGSWQILYIFDTTTNQVIFLQIGYHGT